MRYSWFPNSRTGRPGGDLAPAGAAVGVGGGDEWVRPDLRWELVWKLCTRCNRIEDAQPLNSHWMCLPVVRAMGAGLVQVEGGGQFVADGAGRAAPLGARGGQGAEQVTDGGHRGERVGVRRAVGTDPDQCVGQRGEGSVVTVGDQDQFAASSVEQLAELGGLATVAAQRECDQQILVPHVGEHSERGEHVRR